MRHPRAWRIFGVMANGKGSMRRPLGRISEAELARNWKRTFGSTKRPRNKRVAVERLREAEAAGNLNALSPRLSPEQFIERERETAARLGFTDHNVRAEALPHDADCGCAACRPRVPVEHTDGAVYLVPGPPAATCDICGAAILPESGDTCAACVMELGEPPATAAEFAEEVLGVELQPHQKAVMESLGPVAEKPLAPVTPEVESPQMDRAARRRAHRGK